MMFIFSFILSLFANHLPVMYVQVPQWADDWAVCAVDIPDAKCHWYVMAPDNLSLIHISEPTRPY